MKKTRRKKIIKKARTQRRTPNQAKRKARTARKPARTARKKKHIIRLAFHAEAKPIGRRIRRGYLTAVETVAPIGFALPTAPLSTQAVADLFKISPRRVRDLGTIRKVVPSKNERGQLVWTPEQVEAIKPKRPLV